MKIRLYQINKNRDVNRVCYEGLDIHQKCQNVGAYEVDSSLYDMVFDGFVEDRNSLEGLFSAFNYSRPSCYHGRTMSVSDVVEVIKETPNCKEGFYFCDYVGFVKVEFVRPENKEKTLEAEQAIKAGDYTLSPELNDMVKNALRSSDAAQDKYVLAWIEELEKSQRPKTNAANVREAIAIDFDGCLCDSVYPEIGEPNWDVINAAKAKQEQGAGLILWTCREGELLKQAIDACASWGLHFDAVNDNLPDWKEAYQNDPRKVGATEYWDDRAVCMGRGKNEKSSKKDNSVVYAVVSGCVGDYSTVAVYDDKQKAEAKAEAERRCWNGIEAYVYAWDIRSGEEVDDEAEDSEASETRETNGDYVRSMSDQELADFFKQVHAYPCAACCGNLDKCRRNNAVEPVCERHFAEWLRKEREGK